MTHSVYPSSFLPDSRELSRDPKIYRNQAH